MFVPTPIREAECLGARAVGDVRVIDAVHPPNGLTRAHAHGGRTLSILLAGSFCERVGGHRSDFVHRGALLRCEGRVHADAYGPEGAWVLHLEVPNEDPETDGSESEWLRLEGPRVSVLGWALRAEMWNRDGASALACRSLVDEVVDTFRDAGRRPRRREASAPPPWLRRVVELLNDRFAEPLTVQGIADEVGVHRVTVSREFRRWVGSTTGSYLRHLRLAHAAGEIGLRGRAPSEAAARAGFYDQSHLTRWLRRETGTTPARMRRGRPPGTSTSTHRRLKDSRGCNGRRGSLS